MQELEFRSMIAGSTAVQRELARLIIDIFQVDVSPLDRLGHDPSIVSLGWWCGDELVANVSLYERQLWLLGEKFAALGVQSVAVRPGWRRMGLVRDLMTKALAYADARVDHVLLTTGTPGLYQPFGFRPLKEHSFHGYLPTQPSQQTRSRVLSLADDADVALLMALFRRREPVSLIASATDHPALFMLKTVSTPKVKLVHLPQLDAVVAVQTDPGSPLTLLDIVASSIPSLQEVASALGFEGGEVTVLFTPDRLSWTPDASTLRDNGYMLRGDLPVGEQAVMLSSMTI